MSGHLQPARRKPRSPVDPSPSGRRLRFKEWLLSERRSNTPIGDLARDLAWDLARPDSHRLPRVFTGPSFKRYLADRGACDGALEAAAEAYRLWREAGRKPV